MRHITIPPPWQVHAKIAKSHLTRSTSDPLWQQAPVDADDDLSARCAWSLICDSRNGKWWLAEFGTLCLGTGPPFRNFTWPHLPVGRNSTVNFFRSLDRRILGIGDARVIIDTWIDYMTHRFVHRYMNWSPVSEIGSYDESHEHLPDSELVFACFPCQDEQGNWFQHCKFHRGLVLKHRKTFFFIFKVHVEICFFFLPSFWIHFHFCFFWLVIGVCDPQWKKWNIFGSCWASLGLLRLSLAVTGWGSCLAWPKFSNCWRKCSKA